MSTNEAAERLTPHIFADDSIDADGAYCTRHEHWVSWNQPHTAEGRALVEECGECVTADDVLGIETAERRATVERIREKLTAGVVHLMWKDTPAGRIGGHAVHLSDLDAILDEELTRPEGKAAR